MLAQRSSGKIDKRSLFYGIWLVIELWARQRQVADRLHQRFWHSPVRNIGQLLNQLGIAVGANLSQLQQQKSRYFLTRLLRLPHINLFYQLTTEVSTQASKKAVIE